METSTLNRDKVETFTGQMVEMLNGAMLALQTSIGHRTGLFDSMTGDPSATSAEIASASGLNERYVREWLGAMVTGGIVEYDALTQRYTLPPEHATSLTRASGPDNLAPLARFVSLLGDVEDEIVDKFETGGGVPYSSFPKFQELMAESSAQDHDAWLLDEILPLVEGLQSRLNSGVDLLDVGCGQGHAVNLMAAAYPASRFTGVDISEEAIGVARREAQEQGLDNAQFEVQDAATLEASGAFDCVTAFDAIHDQAKPGQVLRRVHAALRPGGVFLCSDIAASSDLADNMDHPLGPFFYTISTMHCMTVSLAEGGAGLGSMWGEQLARQMMTDAGFVDLEVHQLEGDIVNYHYTARKN